MHDDREIEMNENERWLVHLWKQGFSYKQIAAKIGKPVNEVIQALQELGY